MQIPGNPSISLAWGKGWGFRLSFIFEGSQLSKKRASLDCPIATLFLDLRAFAKGVEVAHACQSEMARASRPHSATNRQGQPERAPLVGGWWSKRRFLSRRRHFVLVTEAGWE